MDELMTKKEFDGWADMVENGPYGKGVANVTVKAAYAAVLARIAELEAQLAAKQEQIERLLNEAAHS